MRTYFMTVALAAYASVALPFAKAQNETIADIISANGNFTVLETFLKLTRLFSVFASPSLQTTLFAPDDEAWGKFNLSRAETLLSPGWRNHIECMLLYHAVPGIVLVDAIKNETVLTTVQGANLTLGTTPSSDTDIIASNGVIHEIQNVLLPPCITDSIVDIALEDPDLSLLVELFHLAGLTDALVGEGPLTVFMPTNAALEALGTEALEILKDPVNLSALQATLQHHVFTGNLYSSVLRQSFRRIAGDSLSINGVEIVQDGDILASNGVIHKLEQVMLPSFIVDLLKDSMSDALREANNSEPPVVSLTPVDFDGCMQVDGFGEDKDSLLLATCDATLASQKFKFESEFIRIGLDESKCLQAGSNGDPENGTKLRVYTCDSTNPLQKFKWEGGAMTLVAYPDLCVVFHGQHANLDTDPILVMGCELVDYVGMSHGWHVKA
jgi:transforming growth factor-beta-induced protein